MPARKRANSSAAPDEPRRRSHRISSTPKKSSYFEDPEDGEAGDGDEGFEDESPSPDEDASDEEVERPAKRSRGRPPAKTKSEPKPDKAKGRKSKVVEDDYEDDDDAADDQDDEDDSEDDDDKPPRVTIIPLEKLRPLDGVDYEDDKLHKNTLLFLKDLKANNTRPWLKNHDGEYRRALKDWTSFVEAFTPRVTAADFTVPELPAKDLMFRIHRDIRFSKDPTPYKPHFSAAWSRTGRKGPYACYYIHAQPGGHCFVGGGLWHPPGEQIRLLRASIDERPARWRRVLNEERFRRVFLEPKMNDTKKGRKGARQGRDDAETAVLAFTAGNQENALKTRPQGFSAEHRDLDLLRLRNYTVGVKIEDGLLTQEDAQDKLAAIIEAMEPFITFLNRIVMPDPDDEDSSDDEQDENENGAANGDDESE